MTPLFRAVSLFILSEMSFASTGELLHFYPSGSSVYERQLYVCEARNLFGKRFSATGTDPKLTQEEALKKCEQQSFRCFAAGCK